MEIIALSPSHLFGGSTLFRLRQPGRLLADVGQQRVRAAGKQGPILQNSISDDHIFGQIFILNFLSNLHPKITF
jgi:hypothetical protein